LAGDLGHEVELEAIPEVTAGSDKWLAVWDRALWLYLAVSGLSSAFKLGEEPAPMVLHPRRGHSYDYSQPVSGGTVRVTQVSQESPMKRTALVAAMMLGATSTVPLALHAAETSPSAQAGNQQAAPSKAPASQAMDKGEQQGSGQANVGQVGDQQASPSPAPAPQATTEAVKKNP
jgi:hypothetical protein